MIDKERKRNIILIENIQTIIIAMLLLLEDTCRIVEWMEEKKKMTNNSHRDSVASNTQIATSS